MASLKLSHIYKVYENGHKAVNDFSIDIADKEFIVFVGPSGCGKSTTLRMIAGLEAITAGDLFIGDTLVNDVEPKDRDIAMVFQSYALYPHMTVYENMAFGLRNRHIPEEEIKAKVLEAARMLDIEEYLDRKPKAMSGGQRQRVALGRALVRDPKVFLLDEPLSNLDAKLRAQMRTEITKLHKKLATTFIYVTHDQVEAMTMGTRIVVMKLGYVQQIDTPMNLYNEPYNKFVAGFIGTPQMNFFDVTLNRVGEEVEVNFVSGGQIKLPYEKLCKVHDSYLHNTKNVIFGIRPEHLVMSETGLSCVVNAVEHLGNECIVYGQIGTNEEEFTMKDEGKNIIIKVVEGTNVNVGDTITIFPDTSKVHFFDGESEITLLQKIPHFTSFGATVKDGVISYLGKDVNLVPALSTLANGEYDIELPPSSIVKGNTYSLKVNKVETIDNKHLAHLAYGDRYVFALVNEDVKEGDNYSFDILWDKVRIVKDGETVHEIISDEVSLVGTFEKEERREIDENPDSPTHGKKVRQYYFYYNINGVKIPAPVNNGYKMNTIEGNYCYKRSYRYGLNRDDISLCEASSTSIHAHIVEELDYGYKKYAKVEIGEDTVLINLPEVEHTCCLNLAVPGDKVSVYSLNIDMKIC